MHTEHGMTFLMLHDNQMAEWVPKIHFSITTAGPHSAPATPAVLTLWQVSTFQNSDISLSNLLKFPYY